MAKNHNKNLKIISFLLLSLTLLTIVSATTQCSNGIDDDGDGLVDALVELTNDNTQKSFGNTAPGTISTLIKQNSNYDLTCSKTRGYGGILRSNSNGWSEAISESQLHGTADKVCNILGYKKAVDAGCHDSERSWKYPNGKCNYDSPGDNCVFYWDGTKFVSTSSGSNKKVYSWITDLTCEGKLAACSDGIDNDGDGKIDSDDDGCASDDDNSEEKHDPDCDSPQDNDEEAPDCSRDSDCGTNHNSQNFCEGNTIYYNSYTYDCSYGSCEQDVTKVEVTSCEYGCQDATCKNRELTECEDSIDNDNDDLTDSDDPGCWNNANDPNSYNPNLDDESRSDSVCSRNSDCGTNGWVFGTENCNSNNVYLNYQYNECENAGQGNSYCSANILNFLKEDCGTNYNSENFCEGNTVYYNTYTNGCSSGNCEKEITKVEVTYCEYGCQNGICQNLDLTECEDGIDNDNDGQTDSNDPGCWNNPNDPNSYNSNLDDESRSDSVCLIDTDCGANMWIIGTNNCNNNNVFANFRSNSCENAGQGNSYCSFSLLNLIKEDCGADTCEDPSETYCDGSSVYYNQECQEMGCESRSCFNRAETRKTKVADCDNGCTDGQCNGFTDEEGPVIILLNPLDSTTQHSEIEFNFTSTDESAIKSCSLIVNGNTEESSNTISTGTNSFKYTPSQVNTNYTWKITCLDVYDNKGESETRNFFYTGRYCAQDTDCGETTTNLICQGDDVIREIVTPSCEGDNTCSFTTTHEFVKECNDRCLNGHCLSDKKEKKKDPIIRKTTKSPLTLEFNNTIPAQILLTSELTYKKTQSINWWNILFILLVAGIILLILLIIYAMLK
jgi:hypothetical protein